METYNYDDAPTAPGYRSEGSVTPSAPDSSVNNTPAAPTPAAPGFSPSGSMSPSVPSGTNGNSGNNMNNSVPATPGFGSVGPVTPSLPSGTVNNNMPAAPGFGPIGPVTPTLPSGAVTIQRPNGCVNCSGTVVRPQGNILWTWGVLSPFFSTSNTIAHVRFYNAAASKEPMDVYLNGRLVVSNLDYMNYTNYLHIVPGYYRLTVYSRTNPNSAVVDTGIQFRGGVSYTMTILGTTNNYSVQLITS